MTPLVRRRLTRQGAGVLSALLAAALLAPPAARASCGDYVVIGDHPAGAHAQPGHPTPDAPKAPPDGRAPCSGPLCSRHHPQAPLAPPAPAPERGDQWGWIDPLPLLPVPGPLGAVVGDVRDRPVRHARTVYHPPR
jgi:hypothetical protein